MAASGVTDWPMFPETLIREHNSGSMAPAQQVSLEESRAFWPRCQGTGKDGLH